MPRKPGQNCPHKDEVETLANDALLEEDRRRVQAHLEECDACLTHFRRLTAENFPRLRQYTILERVGEGGFGIVYKAIHHDKKRTEALKVLFGETELRTAYFENEVQLVARLSHPHIATLYEAHLSSPPMYYCMEFVEGRRLDEYLSAARVSLAERVRIVREVAEAIEYAHGQGVVHRDIKPQNILIDERGRPRIVDFGIARRLGLKERGPGEPSGSSDSPDGPIGTIGYMAPEQSEGKPTDPRTDVYSLGALLYFTVTGDPPRTLRGTHRIEAALQARGIGRPEDLGAIMRRCLEFAPENRYANCAELIADLDSYLVGWPPRAAAPMSASYRVRRIAAYAIRHHAVAARVALALLAVVLLAWINWEVGARVFARPAAPMERVTLVSFDGESLAALRDGRLGADIGGVSAENRKSWRLLHAALLRKLAASPPRVLAFDIYFPDCRPEFDGPLVEAIHAFPAPVVVGAAKFDVNLQPELCDSIRQVASGWGTLLAADPAQWVTEAQIVVALQRGFEPPTPSLALAAFAAWRFAADAPVFLVDAESQRLEIRYRRRVEAAGAPRWEAETDRLPLSEVGHVGGGGPIEPGDVLARARFPMPTTGDMAIVAATRARAPAGLGADESARPAGIEPAAHVEVRGTAAAGGRAPVEAPGSTRAGGDGDDSAADDAPAGRAAAEFATHGGERFLVVPYVRAFAADEGEMATWFAGRAVVVCQMLPNEDEYRLREGARIHGGEIQAAALASMLRGTIELPYSRMELVLRLAAWCGLGAFAASVAPLRSKRAMLRLAAVLGGALALGGILLAGYVAMHVTSRWGIEAAMGLSALLTAGGLGLLVSAARERQCRLSPDLTWPEPSTDASTAAAATRPA